MSAAAKSIQQLAHSIQEVEIPAWHLRFRCPSFSNELHENDLSNETVVNSCSKNLCLNWFNISPALHKLRQQVHYLSPFVCRFNPWKGRDVNWLHFAIHV